ncbi:uncharacterized protein LOC129797937 isoform X2 [Phlebotomus papatasi]|uniref:uncharacterized protein LOC129797937 isoform X2 n=1 Tax=Phlebotomus papatasi TaxID=29031 RepID=UPI0024839784|nr:uncharacterized protein LOC129797937 isoform X2 [Phlebotomus papatasi]
MNITPIVIFIYSLSAAADTPINPNELPSACCGYPQFQNPRILSSCRNRFNLAKTVNTEGCAQECFFNATRIWRDDQPIRAAVMTAFTRFVPNQWRNLISWSTNFCLGKYVSIPPQPVNPFSRMLVIGNPNCNEGPYKFIQCVSEQILRYCPAQRFRATKDCIMKRQIIDSSSKMSGNNVQVMG